MSHFRTWFFTICLAFLTAPLPALSQVTPSGAGQTLALGAFTATGGDDWKARGPALGTSIAADIATLLAVGAERADCPIHLSTDGATDAPGFTVSGATTVANGMATIIVDVRSTPGGAVVTTLTREVPEDSWGDQSAQLARDILNAICPDTAGGGQSWVASGGGARIVISGQIAAYDRPFVLQGVFPGAQVVLEYTPDSAGGGAVFYTFSGGGVSGAGEGVYTIAPQGDGTMLIEQITNGCVEGIPNSCAENRESIVLTPVSP